MAAGGVWCDDGTAVPRNCAGTWATTARRRRHIRRSRRRRRRRPFRVCRRRLGGAAAAGTSVGGDAMTTRAVVVVGGGDGDGGAGGDRRNRTSRRTVAYCIPHDRRPSDVAAFPHDDRRAAVAMAARLRTRTLPTVSCSRRLAAKTTTTTAVAMTRPLPPRHRSGCVWAQPSAPLPPDVAGFCTGLRRPA